MIDGQIKTVDEDLFKRDAIGISEQDEFTIETVEDSYFIIIDVPMG